MAWQGCRWLGSISDQHSGTHRNYWRELRNRAALARSFSADGHPLLLMARRLERLEELELPDAICAMVDVVDFEAVQAAVSQAEERFGPLDAMINNAGVMKLSPLEQQDPAEWAQMLDVNVLGVLNGCRVALDSMLPREHGTVINISSIAGRKTFPNHVGYVGSKFAVHGISENLRSKSPVGMCVFLSLPRVRWKLNYSAIRLRLMSSPVTRRGSGASVEHSMPKPWSKRFGTSMTSHSRSVCERSSSRTPCRSTSRNDSPTLRR